MKITLLFLSLIFTLLLLACQKEDNKPEPSSRLVLVYMVADNDLDFFAIRNINEMERGFQSNSNGDLLVFIDRSIGASPSHPYLMKISHDTSDFVVSEILQTYPEQNSADASTLKRVVADALESSKNKYTSIGLVLWSHGSAWLPPSTSLYSNRGDIIDSVKTQHKRKSFGVDTKISANADTVCEMDIKEMANALSGYYFDFIIFDACFMSSIEVAYELRNNNKYFIASPVEVLSSGFPYSNIVPLFFDKEINPVSIAQSYFNYYSSRRGILNSGSVCVIKSSELENLANAIKNFCTKIDTINLDSTNSILNIDSLQQFDRLKVGVLFDLKQFLQIEASNYGNVQLQNSIQTSWNNAVIKEFHTNYVLGSLSLKHCNGLSTYIPHKTLIKINDYYKTLSWYKASGYDKVFLSNY